jgi:hypothetical protein
MSNRKYTMDGAAADKTLKNVFQACNLKVTERSLQDLKKNQNKEHISMIVLMMVALAACIVIFLIPFYLYSSPANVTQVGKNSTTLVVESHHEDKGVFYLTLSGGEIDYSGIRLVKADGSENNILSFDAATSTIAFAYTEEDLNIYIPQDTGATLHLLLSPKK